MNKPAICLVQQIVSEEFACIPNDDGLNDCVRHHALPAYRRFPIGERIVDGGVVLQDAGERIDHVAFQNGRPLAGRIGDKAGCWTTAVGRRLRSSTA